MACSLIEHKRINTTVAKAKALRVYVEPIITKSKEDTTHNRRIVFSSLQSKDAVTELFREIAPKVMSRPGGYTRIIKTGFRQGDGAETAMIELVDFNEIYGTEAKSKSNRRRRRGGSKTTAPKAEVEATETVEAEAVAETVEEPKAEIETPAVEEAPAVEETPAVEEAAPEAETKEEAPEAETAEEPKAEAGSAEDSTEDKEDSSDSEEKKKD